MDENDSRENEKAKDGIGGLDATLILAILASVQAFSSYTLFTLMTLVGIPTWLAWVLPVSTDAVVLLATKVWLNPNYGEKTRKYAMGLAIGAFVVSVACAGIQHTSLVGVVNGVLTAPEWLRFVVGAIPTAAAGFVVHLVAMVRGENAKLRLKFEEAREARRRKDEEKARREAEKAARAQQQAAKPAPERTVMKRQEPAQAVEQPAKSEQSEPVAEPPVDIRLVRQYGEKKAKALSLWLSRLDERNGQGPALRSIDIEMSGRETSTAKKAVAEYIRDHGDPREKRDQQRREASR